MCLNPERPIKKSIRIREHHNPAFEQEVEVRHLEPEQRLQLEQLRQQKDQFPPTLVWEGAD